MTIVKVVIQSWLIIGVSNTLIVIAGSRVHDDDRKPACSKHFSPIALLRTHAKCVTNATYNFLEFESYNEQMRFKTDNLSLEWASWWVEGQVRVRGCRGYGHTDHEKDLEASGPVQHRDRRLHAHGHVFVEV